MQWNGPTIPVREGARLAFPFPQHDNFVSVVVLILENISPGLDEPQATMFRQFLQLQYDRLNSQTPQPL